MHVMLYKTEFSSHESWHNWPGILLINIIVSLFCQQELFEKYICIIVFWYMEINLSIYLDIICVSSYKQL